MRFWIEKINRRKDNVQKNRFNPFQENCNFVFGGRFEGPLLLGGARMLIYSGHKNVTTHLMYTG
jgi:hypothetical protein